jgi:hypothetical protein
MVVLTTLISSEAAYRERSDEWLAFGQLEDAISPRRLWSTLPSLQPIYSGKCSLREYFRNGRMQQEGEPGHLASSPAIIHLFGCPMVWVSPSVTALSWCSNPRLMIMMVKETVYASLQ